MAVAVIEQYDPNAIKTYPKTTIIEYQGELSTTINAAAKVEDF